MKKLATWIYKTSEQLRSKFRPGERSFDPLPDAGLAESTGNAADQSTSNRLKNAFNKAIGALLKRPSTADADNNPIPSAEPNADKTKPSPDPKFKLTKSIQWLIKPLVIMGILIGFYAILGFYLIPTVLKAKLPDILHEQIGRKASVAKIEFNPFKLIALVQGFKLEEKNGKKTFASFDSVSAEINGLQSLKRLALVVEDVTLVKPTVRIALLKDGKFNFDDMIKPSKKKEPEKKASGLFPFAVAKATLKDGKLLWDDNHFSKPVSEELSSINLKLSGLSSEKSEKNAKGKADLSFAVKSGGKFAWQSTLGIDPIFSEGKLKLDKVQLQKAIALALSDTASFDLQGHELLTVDYKVNMDKDLNVTLKNTKLELRDLQFADKSDAKSLLKTPSFSVATNAAIKLVKDNLNITLDNTKLDSQGIEFSNQLPQPIAIKIPHFNHETDNIKVHQTKEGLKVVANHAKLGIKDVQFVGLTEGKITAKIPEIALATDFRFEQDPKSMDAVVSKGEFAMRDLQVAETGEAKTLIKIPVFDLVGIGINLKNQEVSIESVASKNAEVQAWLNKDGTLNYQHLIPAPAPRKKAKTKDIKTAKTVDYQENPSIPVDDATKVEIKPKKDWIIKVNKVILENFALYFEDKTLKKPLAMTAKPINLKVSDFVNKPDAKLPIQVEIGVNKTGSIKLEGDTVIEPLAAKVDVEVKNIELETFQPYVDKVARLDILDGRFNINGKLVVLQPPKKPLDVKFKGSTSVAELLTRDQLQNKDLVKWQNLTFKDLDVDLLANRYTSSLLLIEKPYAKVTIRKDKTINFSDIALPDKNNADHHAAKQPKSSRPSHTKESQSNQPFFKLDKVKIVDGSSDFADLSLILPFAAQIKSLDGGANGISSEQKSTIKVDLKGNAYDLAPVDINGEISPYLGNFNIDLKFDGMPMPLVTPYMVEFAGYKIEKGKLTLGLKYQVENGKLQAANNILIDQLELGEKVDNPNAVSLPLELAITLLKDSDGKIRLDVPLTGSLEDPQFSISGIIVDALVNVLTKVITSPFTAIASLVGSEEDLSTVVFAPGKDTLATAETGKLDSVAKALKEKPDLNLEIKGAAFAEQDWQVLREEALLDQLKDTKAKQLTKEEGKKIRSEYVELSGDDYNDLLADAFIQRFPTMAEKSLLGTPKLIPPLTGDFYQVAKEKMSELIKPDAKRLKDLAVERSKEIAKYVVQKGGIPNERVYILDSVLDPERKGKDIASTLSLKTN